MAKVRKYFDLYNSEDEHIGFGYSYEEGNCQVFMKEINSCAWQFASLAEVLHITGVQSFKWRNKKPQLPIADTLKKVIDRQTSRS